MSVTDKQMVEHITLQFEPITSIESEPITSIESEPITSIESEPLITKTIHGYDVEEVKTSFTNALLNKDESNAIYWGYELYYSDLKYEIFYLLNEIYKLFYVEKHSFYFNGYLQTLAKEWEMSKRKNHSILGSVIKNLVELDISITDMVFNMKLRPKIRIINYNKSIPDDFNPIDYAGNCDSFKKMSDDELLSLKREFKRGEKNEKKKRAIPVTLNIPIYVCQILDINISKNFEYMPFVVWCNHNGKTSITQTVVLSRRCRRRRICNNT